MAAVARVSVLDPDLTQEAVLAGGGFRRIAGVDEAGRGAWAGPLVILPLTSSPRPSLWPARLASWSSYNTLQRVHPDTLVLRLARALMAGGEDREPRSEQLAMRTATPWCCR